MPLVKRACCSFSAPFGALKPLGYFPEKSHFGGLFRCVSLWELFAFPHLHVLSFRIFCSLRLPCFSSISRLYPSYSMVFVLFTSLLFSFVSRLGSLVFRLSLLVSCLESLLSSIVCLLFISFSSLVSRSFPVPLRNVHSNSSSQKEIHSESSTQHIPFRRSSQIIPLGRFNSESSIQEVQKAPLRKFHSETSSLKVPL